MAWEFSTKREDLELLFDSGSEDEFERFDPNDMHRADVLHANNVVDVDLGLDLWNPGDRARRKLEFHS